MKNVRNWVLMAYICSAGTVVWYGIVYTYKVLECLNSKILTTISNFFGRRRRRLQTVPILCSEVTGKLRILFIPLILTENCKQHPENMVVIEYTKKTANCCDMVQWSNGKLPKYAIHSLMLTENC